MKINRILAGLALGLCLASAARAQDGAADEKPTIQLKSFRYLGTGCRFDPESPTNVSIEVKDGALAITMPPMVGEFGPDIPALEARKNCNIVLTLDAPTGWQYALQSFEMRGFAALDSGLKGEVSLTTSFEGSGRSTVIPYSFEGPFERDFAYKDNISITGLQWSPCDVKRSLLLNLKVGVLGNKKQFPNARGLVTLDSWEPNLYQFSWRRCS